MSNIGLSRSVVRSSAVLAVRIAGAFLQLGLVALVALRYSPHEVGLNGVLWALAVISRMAGAMGLETLGIKTQAPLWAAGDRSTASSFALRDFRVLLSGWSVLLTTVLLGTLIGTLAWGWQGWWIAALAIVAATSGLHRLLVLQLQAKEQALLGQIMELVALPGLAFVGALGASFVAPQHLITSQVIAFLVVTVLLYLLSPCFRCENKPSTEPIAWRTAFSLAGGGLLTAMTSRAPVFYLGMQSLSTAGTYDIAQRIYSAGTLGTSAVTTVYLPRIASSLAHIRTLMRLMVEAALLSLLIPVGLLIALLFFGRDGISAILGAEYSGAWLPAVLLMVSSIVNSGTSAMSYVIMFGEREKTYLAVCAMQLLVVLGGALLFQTDTAAEMAFWVLMGEIFRSAAMMLGFLLHWRSLPTRARTGPELLQ